MTDTHKVFDADGLALYFEVYLSDNEYIDGDEDYDVIDKEVNGESKQFIKGVDLSIIQQECHCFQPVGV